MKIYFGGVLIAIGFIIIGATTTKDTSFWSGYWKIVVTLISFGLGFKLSADYIISRIREK